MFVPRQRETAITVSTKRADLYVTDLYIRSRGSLRHTIYFKGYTRVKWLIRAGLGDRFHLVKLQELITIIIFRQLNDKPLEKDSVLKHPTATNIVVEIDNISLRNVIDNISLRQI